MAFCHFFSEQARAYREEPLQTLDLMESFEPENSSFLARDGEQFSLQRWFPVSGEVKAVLIAIHGIGGAAFDFVGLGKFLVQEKIAVYAPNLRGQGLDPIIKRRGSDFNIQQLLSDIRAMVSAIRQKNPGIPLFFYGESMGALLVAHLLTKEPILDIKGAILAVPVVELASAPSPTVRKVIQLGATYFPFFRISTKWFRKSKSLPLSRDSEMHHLLENVPHRIEKFSLSFINNMGFLIDSAGQVAASIHQPILVLAAGDDDYVNTQAISQWFEKIGSLDKTLVTFPKSYHRLLFDLDRKDVEKTVLQWLKQRCL